MLTALSFCLFFCALSVEAQKFKLPEGFKINLKAPIDGNTESEIQVSWDEIEGALLYEVEFAELYQEEIAPPPTPITIADNTFTGLGSSPQKGAFTDGSHIKIIGSTAGNDGIYKVAPKGLSESTLTLSNANLNPETISFGRTILLKVEAPQWVYQLKKASVFAGQPTNYVFKDLYPGAPHVARIRAITTSDKNLLDPQSDFTPSTLPFYTSRQPLYSVQVNFEEISTHSLKAVWSTPENNNSSALNYLVSYSTTADFKDAQTLKTKETSHIFENLNPETSLFIKVQPTPTPGKYSPYLPGGPTESSAQTLALQPIRLNGVVSITQSALGSLMAEWTLPDNHNNQNIYYKLIVRKPGDNENTPSILLQTHDNLNVNQFRINDLSPLSSYDIEVQAFPAKDNRIHLPSQLIKGSGTTAGSNLESPANFKVTPGIGSLTMSWSKVINNLGDFQYRVLLQSTEGTLPEGIQSEYLLTETKLGPIENLGKEKEYQITLTAEPIKGNKGDLASIPISVLITTLTDEPLTELENEVENLDQALPLPDAQPTAPLTSENNPN